MLVLLNLPAHAQFLTGTWSSETTSGFTPRLGLTSSVINGKIYVMGGHRSGVILTTLEVFDPLADTWSTPLTNGTVMPRVFHTASVVNGKIYLIGGISQANATNPVSTIDVFDPVTETWNSLITSGTFTPRLGHCAAVIGNKIFVFGGDTLSLSNLAVTGTIQVLDLSTNSWSTLATKGSFIVPFLSASNLIGDKIYFTGGVDSTGINSLYTLEIFDPATDTWSIPQTQGVMTARASHVAAFIDSNLIVFGGYGASFDLSSMQAFDLATSTWYTPATTGNFTARDGFCASVVNDKIYAMGGENDASQPLNVNEVFSLSGSGVLERSIDTDIELYPNPVRSIVTIRGLGSSWSSITLFDALGRKIPFSTNATQNLFNKGRSSFDLDLHALPNGSYFIELQRPDGERLQPFIILH